MCRSVLAVLIVSLVSVSAASADLAISPDGKTLVAGGSRWKGINTRVFYVIEAETLKVTHRFYNQARIERLTFNSDGSRLVSVDDARRLRIWDTRTWKPIATIEKVRNVAWAPKADVALVNLPKEKKFRTVSIEDGKTLNTYDWPESRAGFFNFVLSPKADKVLLISNRIEDPNAEPKKKVKRKADMSRAERDELRFRHDGYVFSMVQFDLASGRALRNHLSWYGIASGKNSRLRWIGDKVYAVRYSGPEVTYALDDGEVTLSYRWGFNYAATISPDQKCMVGGSLRRGAIIPFDGEASTFRISRIPGWPEYFNGFAVGPKGTVYAITTASRVMKINQQGDVLKIVPFF
jgi:hypothetical protein